MRTQFVYLRGEAIKHQATPRVHGGRGYIAGPQFHLQVHNWSGVETATETFVSIGSTVTSGSQQA